MGRKKKVEVSQSDGVKNTHPGEMDRVVGDDPMKAKLSKYERPLRTAVYGKYIMALGMRAVDELYDIYTEKFGKNNLCKTCGNDILKICTRLGEYYFGIK